MAPIQILSQRVTTNGEKNYLNILMSGGEEVDAITDITINDQPAENFPALRSINVTAPTIRPSSLALTITWEETTVGVELTG